MRGKVVVSYMNSDGTMKSYNYSNPVFSGQLRQFERIDFIKYSFLKPFMLAKVIMSQVLNSRFCDVVSSAARNELSNWDIAIFKARKNHLHGNNDLFCREVLYQFSLNNNFTLVEHPVGIH